MRAPASRLHNCCTRHELTTKMPPESSVVSGSQSLSDIAASSPDHTDLIARAQSLYDDGLFVQAYTAAAPLGPLQSWQGTQARSFWPIGLAVVSRPAVQCPLVARLAC